MFICRFNYLDKCVDMDVPIETFKEALEYLVMECNRPNRNYDDVKKFVKSFCENMKCDHLKAIIEKSIILPPTEINNIHISWMPSQEDRSYLLRATTNELLLVSSPNNLLYLDICRVYDMSL